MKNQEPANKKASFDPKHPYIKNRVVILNGFADQEILAIMRTIKAMCKPSEEGQPAAIAAPSSDLVFAKTTPKSLQTVLGELIIDMSGDHEYLRNNPPQRGNPA